MTLVLLTPITTVTRYWAAMDIVPPSGDQVPRLAAFRDAHPDIEIDSPADSRGMWCAREGGKILAVKFGLRALLDRLDELLASR